MYGADRSLVELDAYHHELGIVAEDLPLHTIAHCFPRHCSGFHIDVALFHLCFPFM